MSKQRIYPLHIPEGTEIIHILPPEGPESDDRIYGLRMANDSTRAVLSDCTTVKSEIGTAVMIRIGNRLFAFTAKHCLGPNATITLTEQIALPCQPDPKILRIERSQTRDIGFIEILNDPNISAIGLENLCVDEPQLPDDPLKPRGPWYFFIGHPIDLFAHVGEWHYLRKTNFGSHPVHVTPDQFLFVYPVSLMSYSEKSDSYPRNSVDFIPKGYSGCAVWTFHERPAGELSHPGNMLKVHGIQSQFIGQTVTVQVIPIKRWLEYFYLKNPDLGDVLEAIFPFLVNPPE